VIGDQLFGEDFAISAYESIISHYAQISLITLRLAFSGAKGGRKEQAALPSHLSSCSSNFARARSRLSRSLEVRLARPCLEILSSNRSISLRSAAC
jgi:hypothetical protein